MRFIGIVPVVDSQVDADPLTDPDLVPDSQLVGHAGEGPLRERGCTQRLLLGFLGAIGTSTEVEVWALDAATAAGAPADRKFYLVKTATTLNNQVLVEVTNVPARGPFYIRQTAGADDGVVSVGVQEG